MNSVVRSTLALSIALLGSRVGKADCVISGVRPTVPLPTMADSQQFSFTASADCETLRFKVEGSRLTKMPRAGAGTGSRDRTYKVLLTEGEWNSVVDESDTTFTWSVIGTTSAGVTTRVTTTNELEIDEGVTRNLSMADAKLVGEEGYDYAGGSVSGAGDVNGDGNDDVVVGAASADSFAGAAYLVLGPVTGDLNLSLADAKLVGEGSDYAGTSVSGAGDVNDDGNDDLLVGAYHNSEVDYSAGAAYVVMGPVSGTLDLTGADAKLVGEDWGDQAGSSVSDVGDANGDGNDDVLVGAYFNSSAGRSYNGAVYLVLGPVTGTRDLSLADAKLVGEASGDIACTASGTGDVNGDGRVDVLVGAPWNDEGGNNAGAAYLALGPVTGTVDLLLADAKLVGEEEWNNAGWSVSGAGDVDGDGHDDLLVGAPGDPNYGTSLSGAAYLVLGPVTGSLDLALADAELVGEEAGDLAGYSVSGAGDMNGDSKDDLLIGAYANGPYTGAAYLVLGPISGTLDLALADAKLVGEADGDTAGYSVSGTAAVDGDLLIGALGNDELGTDAGAAYLVDGGGLF